MKAVIFDFDGVIVDSHTLVNELFTKVINNELHLGISAKDFAQFPGMRFEHRMAIVAKQKGIEVSPEDIERAKTIGRQRYYDSTSDLVQLYPGIKELFMELKENKMKVCLGSNGSRRTIAKLMDQLGIKDFFDNVVTFDDVLHGKPAPDIFVKNADELGLEYNECVVVGDSIEDVNAAKAAGMKIIAVATTTKRDNLADADIIVEAPKDITMQMIGRLG